MKILALDLGTHTGVAHNLGDCLVAVTHTWATEKEVTQWGKERATRRRDPRVPRFFDYLRSLPRPDLVVFEDVLFVSSRKQAHLWSSFRTAIWLAFSSETTTECIDTSALKKFATGGGSADKDMMKKHLLLQHPEWKKAQLDDNAVDALWLFYWAVHTFGRSKYGQ